MHIIYSYGGGEYLYYIFNFVAMLGSNDEQGISTNVIRMVSLLGVSWALILMYVKNSLIPGITWFLWFTIASFVVIGPKGTVKIKDPIAYGAVIKEVANVPLILAAGASCFSSIGHNLTSKIESVFIVPGSSSYFKYITTGCLFGSKLIKRLQEVRVEDPMFNANLNRFVQQCVVYDVMIGQKYTLKKLRETNDIWNLVANNASSVLGFLYKDHIRNEILTCREGVKLLNDQWNEVIGQIATTQGLRLFGHKRMGDPTYAAQAAKTAFITNLPISYKMFGGTSGDAVDLLKQQMMIQTLREAPAKKANQLGNSYAVAKATLHQRNTYQIAGIMAEESLVVMRAVFEALIYGSFIFVYILIFLPSGYKVLGYYFQGICWIQMWAPLYAILNFIMTLYGHYQSKGILGDVGLTRGNAAALIELHTDITALAGWLSLSIPYIAFMLINKGGVAALVHLASHLGSAVGGSISSAAAEQTVGNISLGNFSQGNISLQTMSGYKYNTNSEVQSGQFSRNLSSGAMKITNPEGNLYLAGQGRTVSTFSTDLTDSQHLGMQLNNQAQHEKSLMEAKSADYATQVVSTQRNVAELMDRLINSENNGISYANDKSFSNSQSLQHAMEFAKKLQNKFGLSTQNSIDAAVGLQALGNGVRFKSTNGFSIAVDNIKDFAESEGYKENTDSIIRASQNLTFDDRQAKEKTLVQQINSSYEQSNMLRASSSVHQQHADRLGKAATLLKSSNYDTKTVMIQDFLSYVANSRGVNSKGRIGYDTAANILDATSGPLAERKQELLQRFQEERTQRAIDYFTNHEIKDSFDLDNAFKVINSNIIANEPKLNHATVLNRADELKYDNERQNDLVTKYIGSEKIFNHKKQEFEQKEQEQRAKTQVNHDNSDEFGDEWFF